MTPEIKRSVIDTVAKESTQPLVNTVGRKAVKRAADQAPLTNVFDTKKTSAPHFDPSYQPAIAPQMQSSTLGDVSGSVHGVDAGALVASRFPSI